MKKLLSFTGIMICILFYSIVNGETGNDPSSSGMGNIRNAYGSGIETAIFNPAILGSQLGPWGSVKFIPLNSYSVGYWSDKLALTPYKEYFSIDEDGQWQALVNQLINSSFRIAGKTPRESSKKITKKIKDGASVYTGVDISLMGAIAGNFAVDVSTSAHIETGLPAAPFLILFSEENGLKTGSKLPLTNLGVQARVTTDIDLAYGQSIDLSGIAEFLNNLTRDITDFKHSSWGGGLTISLGHGYVNLKTVDGSIELADDGSSMIMDATVNLKTSGTGIQGNWDFNNPYEDGFKFAGIGAGVNAGVLMHGEKALISIALQRLGPMVWNDLQERKFDIRTRKLNIMTLFEDDVDMFDPDEGGISPENVSLKNTGRHYSWQPTRLNIGLGYKFNFNYQERKGLRALSDYVNTSFGYEQSLAPWPGRSFVPRVALGAENGFLWGYFPVRAGFVFGGSERVASTAGFTVGLPAFNLQVAYKAVGTPFWFPRKGMELAFGLSTEWKKKDRKNIETKGETSSESSDSETSDSETSDSETSDSETSDSETSDSETSDSETSDSETSDSETSDSETSDSETSDSETSDSETSDSETSDSETSDSETSDSETSDSETSDSETSDSETSDSETSNSETSNSETSDAVKSEAEDSKAEDDGTDKTKTDEKSSQSGSNESDWESYNSDW